MGWLKLHVSHDFVFVCTLPEKPTSVQFMLLNRKLFTPDGNVKTGVLTVSERFLA